MIALVGSILVVPLLCTAGITEHDCICVSTECCAEEASCEPDPCDVVYAKECRRETNHDATNQAWVYLAAFALLILLFAIFRLLHVQEIVALGVLILFALSYVFWRLVR